MSQPIQDGNYIQSIKENINQILKLIEKCHAEEILVPLTKAKDNLENLVLKEELKRNIHVLTTCIANTEDMEKKASYKSSKNSLQLSLMELEKLEQARTSEEERIIREKIEHQAAIDYVLTERKKQEQAKLKQFVALPTKIRRIELPRKKYIRKFAKEAWDVSKVIENAESIYTLDKKEYINLHNGYCVAPERMELKCIVDIMPSIQNIRSQGMIIAARNGNRIYQVQFLKKAHA
ncbi:hypothetical protein [Listeria seeligeri]|nr:hypothetical protein [Listeria seeligeri]MBC1817198.1 hypothetical protein [Listeria seeligeri]